MARTNAEGQRSPARFNGRDPLFIAKPPATRRSRQPPSDRGMLCAMNPTLAMLEARVTLQKMHRLTDQTRVFARHAKMLNASAKNFDPANLLDVATDLLQKLLSERLEFLGASSKIETLARTLPKRSLTGGMSPAAQMVPELRAASKQFVAAVRDAEQSIGQLRDTAFRGLNSPTRTSTPDPATSLREYFELLADLLTKIIERYGKKPAPKR
jgi:hypothetical protein